MFGTIIIETYKKSEAKAVAKYIEEICSPMDTYGWASAGIYCFWDYYTKEILYIGLAADLGERFKQHNGLKSIDKSSCKINQIEDYFTEKEKLGYSIFVQSPLSQPVTHRNQANYRKFLGIPNGMPVENYAGEEGKENIKKTEGQLIEAYRLFKSEMPPWNKVSGSISGHRAATVSNYIQIVKEFSSASNSNFLVSRSTLRELANNATYAWYENNLHGIRMMMLSLGLSYVEALKVQESFNPYFGDIMKRIEADDYMNKRLEV